jgi:hypothetical protein
MKPPVVELEDVHAVWVDNVVSIEPLSDQYRRVTLGSIRGSEDRPCNAVQAVLLASPATLRALGYALIGCRVSASKTEGNVIHIDFPTVAKKKTSRRPRAVT